MRMMGIMILIIPLLPIIPMRIAVHSGMAVGVRG